MSCTRPGSARMLSPSTCGRCECTWGRTSCCGLHSPAFLNETYLTLEGVPRIRQTLNLTTCCNNIAQCYIKLGEMAKVCFQICERGDTHLAELIVATGRGLASRSRNFIPV